MNVTLKPFDFAQAVARAGLGTDGVPLAKSGPVAETGFQKALGQALGAVSKSQNDATAMQREVQLDNPTVSLEQTMVAMQKAQIGFQATLQVRNRLVQAMLPGNRQRCRCIFLGCDYSRCLDQLSLSADADSTRSAVILRPVTFSVPPGTSTQPRYLSLIWFFIKH